MDAPEHHLSVPKRGAGPGVLVLHSWWGLDAFFRRLCGRLAAKGYVALAPDLYGGRVATTEREAKALRAASTSRRKEPVYRLLERKIDELAGHEAVTGRAIAVLGFSMGGHWAFWLAARPALPIAATVTFYAARSADFARTRSRFLCHFADEDPFVSEAARKKLARTFECAGARAETHTYPGTRHWFFESDRPEYDARAARLAWRRTLDFLESLRR